MIILVTLLSLVHEFMIGLEKDGTQDNFEIGASMTGFAANKYQPNH
jgi:hypothetical protein